MQWLWALLDVPAHVDGIMKVRGRGGFAANFISFLACAPLLGLSLWGFWVTDQLSTWHWLAPLRTHLASAVPGTTVDDQGNIHAVNPEQDMTIGDPNGDGKSERVEVAGKVLSVGMMLSLLIWSVNLSPTLIQVAFPPLVRILPASIIGGVVIFLKSAMLFDYVTDWPDMWKLVIGVNWPDWWVITPILQFIVCVITTLISSMVLQTIIAVLATLMIVNVINMAGAGAGGAARARQTIIDH